VLTYCTIPRTYQSGGKKFSKVSTLLHFLCEIAIELLFENGKQSEAHNGANCARNSRKCARYYIHFIQ